LRRRLHQRRRPIDAAQSLFLKLKRQYGLEGVAILIDGRDAPIPSLIGDPKLAGEISKTIRAFRNCVNAADAARASRYSPAFPSGIRESGGGRVSVGSQKKWR
jgi:hypothetical protein